MGSSYLRGGRRRLKKILGSRSAGVDLQPEEVERLASVFNAEWYLMTNQDVADAGVDPFEHFLESGLEEQRLPTPLFDAYYYERHAQVPNGLPQILHYLRNGDEGLRTPSALFDLEWYHRQVPDLGGRTLLEHYLSMGSTQPLSPNRLFSPAWILNSLGLEGLGDRTPLEHYVLQGTQGELDPHPWFSNSAYCALHLDVVEAQASPLAHLLEWGTTQYRKTHRFMNPFIDGYLEDERLETPVGPVLVSSLTDSAVPNWLEDEPLVRNLQRHLSEAHKTAAASLTRDPRGHLALDWAARANAVRLATSSAPQVSIVVPTYNHADDVIRCLESIAETAESTPFEIVLIDDCSAPTHQLLFSNLSGVRVLRNDSNRGFAQSCTRGIEESQAPAILLLNNDTEVLDGFLDQSTSLLFDEQRHVGAVGTMVLASDLSLQDAGCQLVGEGVPVQVGRGENPLDAAFNIVRPITYGSGCSLFLRREAFNEVGGFDSQFEPAFFEENDLCRLIDKAGWEVLYCPAAVVLHREGSTLGRRGDKEREKLFDRQAARYYEKWKGVASALPPQGTRPIDLVFNLPFGGSCVLVIDHRLPEPLHDSGSIRMEQILLELKRQGRTPIILSAGTFVRASSAERLSRQGIGVLTHSLEDPELPHLLRRLLPEIDFVLACRPQVALAARPIISELYPEVPFVFDTVDSHTLRIQRRHEIEGTDATERDLDATRVAERAVLEHADLAIALSTEDRIALASLLDSPPPFVLLPNVHPSLSLPAEPEGRSGLLFVGGYEHEPNVDAVQWFCAEVLPLIEATTGPLPVTLAGSRPTEVVRKLASASISIPGWVEDLSPLYERARVVIAPLRWGAGVKGKVGEAMAYGVPVVTTTIGAEGIAVRSGFDIEVANTPRAFADAVLGLLTNNQRWSAQSAAGQTTIEEIMGLGTWATSVSQLLDAVGKISRPRSRA